MSWQAPVVIFDDEDEAELKRRFVELSAQWPEYSSFDIAQEVFRNLPEANSRAMQAGLVWGNLLELKVRIDAAKRNNGVEPEAEQNEAEAFYKEVLAEARNPDNSASTRYKYHELAAKLKGLIKEPAEAAGSDEASRRRPISFVFAQYPD